MLDLDSLLRFLGSGIQTLHTICKLNSRSRTRNKFKDPYVLFFRSTKHAFKFNNHKIHTSHPSFAIHGTTRKMIVLKSQLKQHIFSNTIYKIS